MPQSPQEFPNLQQPPREPDKGVGCGTGDGHAGVGPGAEPPHCGAGALESNLPAHLAQFAEDLWHQPDLSMPQSPQESYGTNLFCRCRNRRKRFRTCSSLHESLTKEWVVELVMAATLVLALELSRHIAERVRLSRIYLHTCHNLQKTYGTNLICQCRNRRKSFRTCSSLHESLTKEWVVELVMAATLVLALELSRHIAERVRLSRIYLRTRHNLQKTYGTNLICQCRNRRKSFRTCSSLHESLTKESGWAPAGLWNW
eukprot:TRINITY_DN4168_c0_g1_i5.p3 TRINITY_DN4168_c0_g1~~TRINITY_DN4168_c0_g1_i5.p3  ORF type:complete len:258 (+),score=26.30 TRINITY_DN4168_c0_g1_i5:1232-2005(+)